MKINIMKTTTPQLLIYGANGYSAQLIVEELLSRNIKPILAGKNETKKQTKSNNYLMTSFI